MPDGRSASASAPRGSHIWAHTQTAGRGHLCTQTTSVLRRYRGTSSFPRPRGPRDRAVHPGLPQARQESGRAHLLYPGSRGAAETRRSTVGRVVASVTKPARPQTWRVSSQRQPLFCGASWRSRSSHNGQHSSSRCPRSPCGHLGWSSLSLHPIVQMEGREGTHLACHSGRGSGWPSHHARLTVGAPALSSPGEPAGHSRTEPSLVAAHGSPRFSIRMRTQEAGAARPREEQAVEPGSPYPAASGSGDLPEVP